MKRFLAPLPLGLLHLVGILLGETRRWPGDRRFVQAAGALVALVGLFFLERALA
jgi:urease accessory protein